MKIMSVAICMGRSICKRFIGKVFPMEMAGECNNFNININLNWRIIHSIEANFLVWFCPSNSPFIYFSTPSGCWMNISELDVFTLYKTFNCCSFDGVASRCWSLPAQVNYCILRQIICQSFNANRIKMVKSFSKLEQVKQFILIQ